MIQADPYRSYDIYNFRFVFPDPEIFISNEDRANIRNDAKFHQTCQKNKMNRKQKNRKNRKK